MDNLAIKGKHMKMLYEALARFWVWLSQNAKLGSRPPEYTDRQFVFETPSTHNQHLTDDRVTLEGSRLH